MNFYLDSRHNKRIKRKHETKIRLFNRFLSTAILLTKTIKRDVSLKMDKMKAKILPLQKIKWMK